MAVGRLKWDEDGKRTYETGISNGALFVKNDNGTYADGVAWNGLISVTESPDGAEPNALYADNMKYLNLISAEDLKLTVEAYTYPDEFCACNGEEEMSVTSGQTTTKLGVRIGQQARRAFALAYVTKIGTDATESAGLKLHIIYGCTASPSERAYETTNESPDAIQFSWEVSTVPIPVTKIAGARPTAILTIDSRTCAKWDEIYGTIFGNDADETASTPASAPTLKTPDQIYDILTTD